MKTCSHARRTYLHTIGQCPKFKHAWCKTNELSLTYTQIILSHCFEFVFHGYLGDWDWASARLPTYLCHRGLGQDVVQENWILKKNDFLFFIFIYINKRWSFEQPFWKIKVFKNQTNLFDYEGSRSLNSCNQNLLFSFEYC